jgi:hypothetical protein
MRFCVPCVRGICVPFVHSRMSPQSQTLSHAPPHPHTNTHTQTRSRMHPLTRQCTNDSTHPPAQTASSSDASGANDDLRRRRLPLDWSLAKRVRFTSQAQFDWTLNPKSATTARAISGCVIVAQRSVRILRLCVIGTWKLGYCERGV